MLEAALAMAAKPLVETLVKKLIAPKISKFSDWCEDRYKEYLIPKAEHFQEYLERSYIKYGIVNTMVFHNSQRELKDIYVTQTIVKMNSSWEEDDATKIDQFPKELLKKYKKILIQDTAGMGKSTITKRMFIDLIDNGMDGLGIPIYIELNRLSKGHNLLQEIQKELNSLSEEFDNDLLLRLIQTGGFIFFLDGYDEISITDRNEVTLEIKDFISKASEGNYFILTSRPEGNLTSFGDFQLFNIQPLTEDEAYELLKKYDKSKNKELSTKLVKLLQSGEYDSLEEFLENPLLVSLLYTAYDYNGSIPLEKHRFYGVVFEAYFEKHDNTKAMKKREKHSGLNYDSFDRILRYIGYDCLINVGVKFNKDTILNTIRKAMEFCGISNISEYAFLEDLVSTVPLFCKDGTDYKWVHKSLLEYFAARFLFCDAKQCQDTLLTAIYNNDQVAKYINMLDLYYDIDVKGFSKNITLPFCESYLQFHRNCIFPSNISDYLIEERISCLFWGSFAFAFSEKSRREMRHLFIHKGFDNTLRRTHHNNMNLFFAYDFHNNIIELLFRKKRSLFKKDRRVNSNNEITIRVEDWSDKILQSFKPEEIHTVDVKTGDENEEIYDSVNKMIIPRQYCILDYLACTKEVDRIHKEISNSKDLSDLLPKN